MAGIQFPEISTTFTANDFEIIRDLGRGRFGKTLLATEKASGSKVALKSYDKNTIQNCSLHSHIYHEMFIHSKLHHPNIIQFLGCFVDYPCLYLIHSLAEEGSLRTMLFYAPISSLNEETAAKFCSQIADALLHVHSHGYCHGDVRPESILIDRKMNAKLSEFGLSWPYTTISQRSFRGPAAYFSPEMIKGDDYDQRIDIWALGILLYEMLTGELPYGFLDEYQMKRRIKRKYIFPDHVSVGAQNVIKRLLVRVPNRRMSLSDVLTHEWILNCVRAANEQSSQEASLPETPAQDASPPESSQN